MKRYTVITRPTSHGPEYLIYDQVNNVTIEGDWQCEKWAQRQAEVMEEKNEQDKIRFGNGEVDSRQGTE